MKNVIQKIFAGINCIIIQFIYINNLKLKFPSIAFSLNSFHLSRESKVNIGKRAVFGKNSEIIAIGQMNIGENFNLNKYSRVVSHNSITIGNNVTIAEFVSILDHDHAYVLSDGNLLLKGYKTSPISIGNNVWIGDKVTICKGVKIGNNVIIGANSLVNKDIESNCVAAGIPCKMVKSL